MAINPLDFLFNRKSADNTTFQETILRNASSSVLIFDATSSLTTKTFDEMGSIIIPNTEDLDFYKYFDTQVKYGVEYTYEVIAWTFIIGNKYKYFDRINTAKVEAIPEIQKNSLYITSVI